ncbi:MAG: hypothetical protein KDI09_13375 [Halioglobus sp.]|nr:hypothetical protein [Halioglobus sp.]
MHAHARHLNQTHTKDASGRGAAVIAYGLLLGSIMILVTAPIAIVLAYAWRARSADWVASHFSYQIRTFWWAIAGLLAGVCVWWLLGRFGLASGYAWTLGYLVFTAELAWLITRCALGLNRLISNEGMRT